MTTPGPRLPTSPAGWLIWVWGVGGVCLILANPIVRLAALPIEAIQAGMTPFQWAVAAVWTAFMLYSEAWRGFHKQFSPRVVVRGLALAEDPKLIPVLLAPLTCMGLLHATKKRKIIAWTLLTGIVILIVGVRQLPTPWRAIVDLGVVLGLAGGLASTLWFAGRAVMGHPPDVPSDMPAPDA